jgi:hypothetical protein
VLKPGSTMELKAPLQTVTSEALVSMRQSAALRMRVLFSVKVMRKP